MNAFDRLPDAAAEIFGAQATAEQAPFSRAEFIFRAAHAGGEEAALLGVPEGGAVFVAERLTWLADKPITFVRMVHPPSHRVVTEL